MESIFSFNHVFLFLFSLYSFVFIIFYSFFVIFFFLMSRCLHGSPRFLRSGAVRAPFLRVCPLTRAAAVNKPPRTPAPVMPRAAAFSEIRPGFVRQVRLC